MKSILNLIILSLLLSSCSKPSNDTSSSSAESNPASENPLSPLVPTCPEGYVQIQPLEGFTQQSFCVAKFEMKNINGQASSVSQESPWANINRTDAINACTQLGSKYDLINNNEWMTIARRIASQPINWSSGQIAVGELNRGHSDSLPAAPQPASDQDDDSCFLTEQSCSKTLWDSQRRIHFIDENTLIWDLAGNVLEWVKDDNLSAIGADTYISMNNTSDIRQTQFGPAPETICPESSISPYCGMGYGHFNYSGGTLIRGGSRVYGLSSGIFQILTNYDANVVGAGLGFRCVYHLNE